MEKATTRKKRKNHKVPDATEILGAKLKRKRSDLGYSLSDISEMTGFSTSTIVDMENGVTTNINYYLEYAKTIQYELRELFNIDIGSGGTYPLSPQKLERAFLTRNIKNLHFVENYFLSQRDVSAVVKKLDELQILKKEDKNISSKVSAVLINLVGEGLLEIDGKEGRNNLYKLRSDSR